MELNLLIIILYLFKTINIPIFKRNKENFYDKIKTDLSKNSKFIFEINIDDKKCIDLNYNKFACKIFNIEKKNFDNYKYNYDFIIQIIYKKNKNIYINLEFYHKFIFFYENLFYNFKLFFFNFLKYLSISFKYFLFFIKNINAFFSHCFPLNLKIQMNIIEILCIKEKSLFLFELSSKQINIINFYILFFINLILINGKKYIF